MVDIGPVNIAIQPRGGSRPVPNPTAHNWYNQKETKANLDAEQIRARPNQVEPNRISTPTAPEPNQPEPLSQDK